MLLLYGVAQDPSGILAFFPDGRVKWGVFPDGELARGISSEVLVHFEEAGDDVGLGGVLREAIGLQPGFKKGT